ncbi:MAG: twin arginine-targeting protein translocase TatB [Acidobacteria bacterium RIFCSPLOWO2_02_FULL_61_28]|nr:MAG: twin arginine-targeting protein translocase TatB [Acidobacteria bacterium RIFCSPLOWO2_02_FULL_61_28]
MGNIGFPELIVIFVVALLVFGPRRLPELGRSLGRGLAEFRRASSDLKNSIEREIEAAEIESAKIVHPVAEQPSAPSNPVPNSPAPGNPA